MDDLFPWLAITLVGAFGAGLLGRRLSRRHAQLVALSFVAHVAGSLAQVWIVRGVYGEGDMIGYWMSGIWLGHHLQADPFGAGPELLRLFLQMDHHLPFHVPGQGAATGSMRAFCSLLAVVTGGSLYAMAVLVAVGGFFSKAAVFFAARRYFEPRLHTRLLVAIMLVPSVVFWSAGLLKESVAVIGLGAMVTGTSLWEARRRAIGILIILPGAVLAAMVKPYILLAFVTAAGVWLYWGVALRTRGAENVVRPVYFAIAAAATVGGVLALGELFPRFSVEGLGEEAARLQGVGQDISGGSNYLIGDESQRTLQGQLAFAPIALVTAFFRPFPFEVNNGLSAVASAETSLLLFFLVRTVIRTSWRAAWRTVRASPLLMFCLTFAVVLGIGVGLGTTNMGTLSRYRSPLLPYLALIVAVLSAPLRRRAAAANVPVIQRLAGSRRAAAR